METWAQTATRALPASTMPVVRNQVEAVAAGGGAARAGARCGAPRPRLQAAALRAKREDPSLTSASQQRAVFQLMRPCRCFVRSTGIGKPLKARIPDGRFRPQASQIG